MGGCGAATGPAEAGSRRFRGVQCPGLAALHFAQPPSARGNECQAAVVKLLPLPLLDHLRPLIAHIAGAHGSYGAPGEPGAMVDEAQWQPASDPANPFPVSVQL